MSELSLRELGDGDADIATFVELSLRYVPEVWDITPDDVRWWDRISGGQLRIAIDAPDGEPVGLASAACLPGDDDTAIGIGITLAPAWTSRGAGTRALERIEAWSAGRRATPRLQVGIDSDHEAALGWWRRRGFAERDRWVITEAAVDTAAPPPEVRDIDGITFTTPAQRPDLLRAAYDASTEFRRDMPGEAHEPLPYEEFTALIDKGERPMDSILLALDVDRIVGICTLVLASDGRRAHTGFTGIAREWRGRGVASALKQRQVAWCRANAITSIRTSNHDDNAAMRAVNEQVGFRAVREVAILERAAT